MSNAYQISLQTGSTRLCRCFKLTRGDGVVFGFTDHDENVSFDGVTFMASAALTASEAASTLGLAPDELDASGALSDDAINERDLVAGLYDGAQVDVYDVDWSDVSVQSILGRYTIGEVERTGIAFRSELRSMVAGLDRKKGRVYSTLCDVKRLGNSRCKLGLAAWTGSGVVTSSSGLGITASGLSGFASGFFDRGTLTWTSGANDGASVDVRGSAPDGSNTRLSLWRRPSFEVNAGDTFEVVAGCDRTAATCRLRFDNLDNFRGFPHMPGESFAGEYARQGDPDQTGGSRFET